MDSYFEPFHIRHLASIFSVPPFPRTLFESFLIRRHLIILFHHFLLHTLCASNIYSTSRFLHHPQITRSRSIDLDRKELHRHHLHSRSVYGVDGGQHFRLFDFLLPQYDTSFATFRFFAFLALGHQGLTFGQGRGVFSQGEFDLESCYFAPLIYWGYHISYLCMLCYVPQSVSQLP